MNREERGSTRETGYRAAGFAVLTAALCLADAALAPPRGAHAAEPAWAGRTLTPSLEAGPRRDGGDAKTGAGLELGGGLSFPDRSSGAGTEFRTRGPVARGDGSRTRGAPGRGLSFSLLPSWDDPAYEARRPWLPENTVPIPPANDDGRLDAELGYGLDAFDGQGVLTPYLGVAADGGGREMHGGVRLRLSTVYGDIPGAAEGTDLGGAHRAGAALARPPEWMSSAVPLSAAAVATRKEPAAGTAANDVEASDRTEPAIPPAAPRAADGPRYRVQLGAFSRPAVARRARTALAGALEEILGGGERALVVDDSRGDGLSRVVLADSFAGRRAAAAVCAEIAARGRECYVARAR